MCVCVPLCIHGTHCRLCVVAGENSSDMHEYVALLHTCEFCCCLEVCVCDVFLPLVVFSARVERFGLSGQTLSRSTSEMHILAETERGKGRKCQ